MTKSKPPLEVTAEQYNFILGTVFSGDLPVHEMLIRALALASQLKIITPTIKGNKKRKNSKESKKKK